MRENKFCSFYVSEAHLVTMLLPYMKQKMEENYNIQIFSQIDLSDVASKIIENIISREEKSRFKKINWKKNKHKISNFENNLIIIIGDRNFMLETEKEIEEKLKDKDITINCFEYDKPETEILDILKNYEGIINTKGEIKKDEMFTQFTQKARKGNKEITIMK